MRAVPLTPDEYLLAFHARHAGATARAFGGGRLADGRSSYQLLADSAPIDGTTLDLGCGDGHLLELLVARGLEPARLIGLDMSEAELAAARRRPALAGVRLLGERAQATSLPDSSIDCLVSHLAFMLMSEIETVVAELARILRPGGRFVTVVGGGPGEGDAFELFLDRFNAEYAACAVKAPAIGDRRTRDAAGMASLFHPDSGFETTVAESAHTVRLDDTAERLWASLASIYQMMVLPPDVVARLRSRFFADAAPMADADGRVPCTMRIRLLAVTRRGPADHANRR